MVTIQESKHQKRREWVYLAVAVAFFLAKDVDLANALEVFLQFLRSVCDAVQVVLPGVGKLLPP